MRLTWGKGHAFLDKKLFTTFQCHASLPQASDDPTASPLVFEINFQALLETLQIVSAIYGPDGQPSSMSRFPTFNKPSNAFSASTLGLSSLCTITYPEIGMPLTLILREGNIETACELTTYEPNQIEDIPFSREKLAVKVIMRSEWLADAISELAATNPEKLTIEAGPGKIGFRLSASGPLGSADVQFDKSKTNGSEAVSAFSNPSHFAANPNASAGEVIGPGVLETFLVQRRNINSYKFATIRAATLAMKQAIKVSIRVDEQGVLSLQFMIEVETASGSSDGDMSFIDFRFVPLVADELGNFDRSGEDSSDDDTQEEEEQ
jgi:cell cycle checkpoint protein